MGWERSKIEARRDRGNTDAGRVKNEKKSVKKIGSMPQSRNGRKKEVKEIDRNLK